MKNIIVSGANGFIGKMLIESLLKENVYVVALDVRFDDMLLNRNNVMCVNVLDKSMDDIIKFVPSKEYDCFFHFAWMGTSGVNRMDYNIQLENIKNTCDYIKMCKEINCKRMLYASSINEMETYEYLQSDNINPSGGYIYGTGKLAAHLMGETVAKLEGVEFIPVIITNIYGIGEKSARMIYTSLVKLIKGEHCSFTKGEQMYDFIYISDAINSIICVAKKGKPFNRYYIGSGRPQKLKNFLLKMRDIVSPNTEIGLGDLEFNGIDISYSQFDMKKVKRDTGYINKISFADGIRMTAEYIKKEIDNGSEI